MPESDHATASDQDLLTLWREGNAPALETLLTRHAGLAWQVAFRVCQDRHEAEEVVQMAFLRIVTTAHQCQSGQVRAWMMAIVRNLGLNRRRDEERRRRIDPPPPSPTSAGEGLERAETVQAVRSALADLAEEDRSAIQFHYFDRMSVAEVAAVLGRPAKTVESRIRRAVERLRPRLARFLSGGAAIAVLLEQAGAADRELPPAGLVEGVRGLIARVPAWHLAAAVAGQHRSVLLPWGLGVCTGLVLSALAMGGFLLFRPPVILERSTHPAYRGRDGSNIQQDGIRLGRIRAARAPIELWRVETGSGYGGAAVERGRIFLADHDAGTGRDLVRCLDLADGCERWSKGVVISAKSRYGISRSTPAVARDVVVHQGPTGILRCLAAKDGAERWRCDLPVAYGTRIPPYLCSQSPLIDGDRVVVAIGGTQVLMAAFNLADGRAIWTTTGAPAWGMSYGSVSRLLLPDGSRACVYAAVGGVVVVDADSGRLLASDEGWNPPQGATTPVDCGQGRIFLTGGSCSGCRLMRTQVDGTGAVRLETAWEMDDGPQGFGTEVHAPILHQGLLYGIHREPGRLVCLDLEGKRRWDGGPGQRFGNGPSIMADGLLFVVTSDGQMEAGIPDPMAWRSLTSSRIDTEGEVLAPLVVVGGRMLIRDGRHLHCLDLTDEGGAPAGAN